MPQVPGRDRVWIGAIIAIFVVGVVATYLLAPLNPNLRYEAGAKEVTGSAAGSFCTALSVTGSSWT